MKRVETMDAEEQEMAEALNVYNSLPDDLKREVLNRAQKHMLEHLENEIINGKDDPECRKPVGLIP